MGRASLLLQGCEDPPSSTTAEGESRWKRSESSGVAFVVTPTGGRSWHYKFYFEGKCKKLMLGTYPEISLECAKSRHQYARNLLAQGINQCEMKATLGKNGFVRRMRDWEIANHPRPECSAESTMAGI